jgi:hypothetical protein
MRIIAIITYASLKAGVNGGKCRYKMQVKETR